MLTIWSTWWCYQEPLPCQANCPIGHLVDNETEVGNYCQGRDPGNEGPRLTVAINKSIWIDITSCANFGPTDNSSLSTV